MILSQSRIQELVDNGEIVIHPYRRECVNPNSYDVHLGEYIGVYVDAHLDAKKHNKIQIKKIPLEGMMLMPGELYLAVTEEYTESHTVVPTLDGKSSVGRLGIDIHCTAGKGDVGFCGKWTMEIKVVKPVIVYSYMKIGQLTYYQLSGGVEVPQKYNEKTTSKYNNQSDLPMESMMWKNFSHLYEPGL